ncbi:MAG: hypothetical protein GXO86_11005 [Chlorobi bacterium]|nr:hypothetical protein [Chlorobiota bacterium]
MKKSIWIMGIISLFFINSLAAQDEELSPYFKVTEIKGSMKDAGTQVIEAITENGDRRIQPGQKR